MNDKRLPERVSKLFYSHLCGIADILDSYVDKFERKEMQDALEKIAGSYRSSVEMVKKNPVMLGDTERLLKEVVRGMEDMRDFHEENLLEETQTLTDLAEALTEYNAGFKEKLRGILYKSHEYN